VGAPGDLPAQPGGVQDGSRGEDPFGRQPRYLLGQHGQHVARIGDDDDDRPRSDLEHLRHQRPHDLRIGGRQFDAGLTRTLLGTGGDHHDMGAFGHRDVGSTVDFAAAGEQGAVGEIEHLGLGLLRGDVVERDMSRRATDEGGVGDTRPHSAGTDDCQFRVLDHGVKVTGCRPLGRDVLGSVPRGWCAPLCAPPRGSRARPHRPGRPDGPRARPGPAHTGAMVSIPVDSTLAILREGYPFASSRFEALGEDVFTTRLVLRPVTFLRGEQAAAMFYGGDRFTRQGAMPATVQLLLQDKGSVQALDSAAHRHRQRSFMSLMGPAARERIAEIFDQEWHRARDRLRGEDRVLLHDLSRVVLTRTAARWAGIPLSEADLPRLTTELSLMFTQVASFGPANWYAQRRRRGTERWAADLVRRVRSGQLTPDPGTTPAVFADHRDESGRRLPEEIAA